jgi:hypothetical protein
MDDDDFQPPEDVKLEIVHGFITSMLGNNEDVERILMVWGKHHPVETRGSVIPSMESMLRQLMYNAIELSVHSQYVEVFRDASTLRIPRTLLNEDARKYLEFFEDKAWSHFFRSRQLLGINEQLSGFHYNHVLTKLTNRIMLIKIVVFKTLMACMMQGLYLDGLEVVLSAINNILFARAPAEIRSFSRDELELVDLLAILRNPNLFNILEGIHARKTWKKY